ncbi:methyltransferase domain-containing protein [Streptomyces sp. NPDC002133]|uniref:methyltransferase domain-containing protein n=1 Tax=Streptomyces sp. NPDC002133 TaxID=3154409 RepID=UPI003323FF5F
MNWSDTDASAAARQRLAVIVAGGCSSEWADAFASVPRHVFVPRLYQQDSHGAWMPLAWGDAGYLEAVYSDTALTTRLDNRGVPNSYSTQPSLMLAMLEALETGEGHRVLELGTGTGYDLALICHRLGDTNVTSVDIDPQLVESASRHLRQAGFIPTVVAGHVAEGYPRNAPYDRIISTVGLHMIPRPLLRQAALGAIMVVPLGYGVVRAIITGPGHAYGRFLPAPAHFTTWRTTSVAPQLDAALEQPPTDSTIPPSDLLERLHFPTSVALPGHTTWAWRDERGALDAVALWTPDGSTAIVHASGSVHQFGPQRLWDTVEDLAKLFLDEPARDDFLLTITPTCQTVTYGDTEGPAWNLPAVL